MISKTTRRFRETYGRLPEHVQRRAREAYRRFRDSPKHPSLRFKQVHATQPIYSARVGLGYRAPRSCHHRWRDRRLVLDRYPCRIRPTPPNAVSYRAQPRHPADGLRPRLIPCVEVSSRPRCGIDGSRHRPGIGPPRCRRHAARSGRGAVEPREPSQRGQDPPRARLGSAADRLSASAPFVYLVARDSIVSPEALEAHYASVESMYHEHIASDTSLDYLGRRPAGLFTKRALADLQAVFATQGLAAGFETVELAIDPDELAALIRRAVAESPRIRFLPGHRVEGVERRDGPLRVEGSGPEGAWHIDADQVVNALWEDRRRVDASYGLPPEPGWLHRLKFRVIVHLPDALRSRPSATMVLGRYGDVVIRRNGTAILSWYPLGLRGWTQQLATPAAWRGPCRGEVDPREVRSMAEQTMAAIDTWYPGIRESEPLSLDAGVIEAYGYTDVDDTRSALHDRSRIGVTSVDGYHSVEPGKLTTAPVMAKSVADRIVGGTVLS